MPSAQKCVLPGCDHVRNRSVSLFKFPKNDHIKKRWINFVKSHLDGELRITTKTRLCSDHFTRDSFINFRRRQLGFTDNPLLLVNGAEPTISRLGPHPPVAPTTGAIIGSACPPMTQSLPTTKETESFMHKVTREVGCQTDHFVGKRTVATQLSKRTLANIKSTGSQATVATKSVAVGNTTAMLLPLCSSTPMYIDMIVQI
ncbi:THAP domain-containing protein 10-like isoform X1 [Xyrauchen texanus]|uniref:THAP domain-containing protein 10-like isoform X1 n=1 Tax=Xyrauchen texanus TaxID=154827 RepID=UPI002242C597|nr:THAP domain-containing protein 10-like isoform X1 [Xyrauchen texanus]XP_051956519.1 THAP domain-containing protein 10-like isoform X1 [Xyrauchen texanus]